MVSRLLAEDGYFLITEGLGRANSAELEGFMIGAGTQYVWKTYPTGLGGAEIRTADRNRPRRRGVIAGDDLTGQRVVEFVVQVKGSPAVVEQALSDLSAAFAPRSEDVWLTVKVSGFPATYALRGRPRGVTWDLSRRFTFGVGDASILFVCTDPLKYGDEVTTTINLPTGDAGLEFPADGPFDFAAGGGGDATLMNTGNASVDWSVTLAGPMTTPRLELVELGSRLAFDIEVPSGETLVINSATTSALLGGTTPRTSAIMPGSRWWQVPPGPSTLRLRAVAGSGTATVTFRPGFH